MTRARHLIGQLAEAGSATRTAAALAVALEEIEYAARKHGLDEVGHFAAVAGLAAWEQAGFQANE